MVDCTLYISGERGKSNNLPSIMQRASNLPRNRKLAAAAAEPAVSGAMGAGNKPRGEDTNSLETGSSAPPSGSLPKPGAWPRPGEAVRCCCYAVGAARTVRKQLGAGERSRTAPHVKTDCLKLEGEHAVKL
jgi:hypothetical protein